MAERSSFFDAHLVGEEYDRVYNAANFAEYFATFIGNGIFPNPATGCQITANDNMTVTLNPGKAWIDGRIYFNDSIFTIPIDLADGVFKRIDRIVLRYDVISRAVYVVVKKGEFASSPVPKDLQRDADAYELGLADIYINNGSIMITQSAITDLRLNATYCGVVHGLVDQVDTTAIFDQYMAWFLEKKAEFNTSLIDYRNLKQSEINQMKVDFFNQLTSWETTTQANFITWENAAKDQFDTWYANIIAALDGDTAGNLLNKINVNTTDILSLSGVGRTTENVKQNADDIIALKNLNINYKRKLRMGVM